MSGVVTCSLAARCQPQIIKGGDCHVLWIPKGVGEALKRSKIYTGVTSRTCSVSRIECIGVSLAMSACTIDVSGILLVSHSTGKGVSVCITWSIGGVTSLSKSHRCVVLSIISLVHGQTV